MAPPGLMARPASGGTASPSKTELIKTARLVLDNCGISFSQNKVVRLVMTFQDRAPSGSGHAFFLYLASAVELSDTLKNEMDRLDIERADLIRRKELEPTAAFDHLARQQRVAIEREIQRIDRERHEWQRMMTQLDSVGVA